MVLKYSLSLILEALVTFLPSTIHVVYSLMEVTCSDVYRPFVPGEGMLRFALPLFNLFQMHACNTLVVMSWTSTSNDKSFKSFPHHADNAIMRSTCCQHETPDYLY